MPGQSTPVPYEPRTRKGHRKVRTGCTTCKRRKIKCDEGKPVCANCLKYGVQCAYAEHRLTHREHGTAPATPAAPAATAYSPAPAPAPLDSISEPTPGASSDVAGSSFQLFPGGGGGGDDLPMALNSTHLELLHNFTTLTCHTLSGDPIMRNIWRINVPQVGFRYDYVMRSLLALSALHMSFFSADRREFYLRIAQSEHNAALPQIASALGHATAENCSALYISATLTFIYAWATPRRPGDFFLVNSNLGTADWVSLLRGVRSIIETWRAELLRGPFSVMFQSGHVRYLAGAAELRSAPEWLATAEHAQLTHLAGLVAQAAATKDEAEALRKSIDDLEDSFCAVSTGGRLWNDHGSVAGGGGSPAGPALRSPGSPWALTSNVYAWLFKMGEPFIEMLKRRSPLALVIFAHFCVVLNFLENWWWMQGWSAHLLQEIWDLLDEEHRVWIRWPIEEIGWRPNR